MPIYLANFVFTKMSEQKLNTRADKDGNTSPNMPV